MLLSHHLLAITNFYSTAHHITIHHLILLFTSSRFDIFNTERREHLFFLLFTHNNTKNYSSNNNKARWSNKLITCPYIINTKKKYCVAAASLIKYERICVETNLNLNNSITDTYYEHNSRRCQYLCLFYYLLSEWYDLTWLIIFVFSFLNLSYSIWWLFVVSNKGARYLIFLSLYYVERKRDAEMR